MAIVNEPTTKAGARMIKDEIPCLLKYEDFLKEAKLAAERFRDKKLVVATMDISNFGYVNSIYGYEEGDRLLIEMAQQIAGSEGFVCGSRLYSDHFVILYCCEDEEKWFETSRIQYREYLKKLRRHLTATFVIVYVGLYFWQNGEPIEKAVDKASIARKNVKGNYRKPVCIYEEEQENRRFKDAENIVLFKTARTNGRIVVMLQPKISLDTKEIIGVEALARLKDEDGRIYMPEEFIPTLERVGYITALDNEILRRVLALLKEWKERGLKIVPVSVNWSYLHFEHDMLAEDIINMVDYYGVEPEYLEFEITERAFIDNMERFSSILEKMRKYGFKISVDDFGSGYSSFNVMGTLPVDIIKLDKGFLDSCLANERGIEVVRGAIDIIKRVKLQVICEGVETLEQETLLKELGCESVQGFLYDKPLEVDRFVNKYLIKDNESGSEEK